MKKVVIGIFICIFVVFTISKIKLEYTSLKNCFLERNINNLKVENAKLEKENETYSEDINALVELNKDKWEELEIWKKAKEKLEKAISR